MSCSPFDLRDYFLEELASPQQQRQVEAHVKTCASCREELDRLRITKAALGYMAEEEIPQRIAFVSDKIFEPSPWRRRLAAFWNSGARLGFVSAAMLSASLLGLALKPAPAPVFNLMRPAAVSAPAPAPVPAAVTRASAVSEAEVQQRIQAAVKKAVDLKTKDLMQEIEADRVRLMLAATQIEQNERRVNKLVAANYGLPERYLEEVK